MYFFGMVLDIYIASHKHSKLMKTLKATYRNLGLTNSALDIVGVISFTLFMVSLLYSMVLLTYMAFMPCVH